MTNGQVAQLQELDKCYGLRRSDMNFIKAWQYFSTEADRMLKGDKADLRCLTHQYRHQIKAMKRNRI